MNTQFSIDAASCSVAPCAAGATISATIRNTGQPLFDPTKTSFYIDGKPIALAGCAYGGGAACAAATFSNGCTYTCSKVAVAGDPLPNCPSQNPAKSSSLKAVIATGLEQDDTVAC
jgi:hypothetical protein